MHRIKSRKESTLKNNNPRVLSVCTAAYHGGAARAAFRIHQGVNALGGSSTMLVKGDGCTEDKVLGLNDFIPDNLVYRIGNWTATKVKNKWQHYLWSKYPRREDVFLSDLRSTSQHGALRKIDFDILHLHWVNLRFFPLEELRKINKPIVWTLHDCWPFCGICHYFLECDGYKHQCGNCPFLHSEMSNDLSHIIWKRKKELYKGLNLHIVTPSHWLANCAKESSLFGDFPVSVIPNCIDTDVFKPMSSNELHPKWRSFREERTDKHLVLYGAMNATTDRIKGYSNLVSSLHILEMKRQVNNIELIVFGAENGLDSIPKSIPVHYAGLINDTDELVSMYNIADVTVVPSLTENLSCTIMESLSCGTPVVAFNIGGNSDMIRHQVNGWLAKETDVNGLGNGIIWCINNKFRLSKVARETVISQYSPLQVCQKYLDKYNEIKQ